MFHVKLFTSPTQQTGLMGEDIAVKYLKNKGFLIVDRNYTKKIGEIDIVAQKEGIIHFIEVKTIINYGVSRETGDFNQKYRPFENVTPFKLRKLSRTIEWFLSERGVSRETPWVIDVIAVTINQERRTAKVEVLWNVIK